MAPHSKTCRSIIFVMNCIWSAHVGWYIDCKNVHGLSNMTKPTFRNTYAKERIDREVASKIGRGVRMLLGWILWKWDGSGWNWLKNDCSEGFGICSESTDLLLENVQDSKSEKPGWPLCPTRHNTSPSTLDCAHILPHHHTYLICLWLKTEFCLCYVWQKMSK